MLWLIIFGAIGVILGAIYFGRELGGFEGVFLGILSGVMFGLVAGLLANVVAIPFMGGNDVVESQDLQSMATSSGISGTFFLGIGTVDSTPEYHYFVKTANGGFEEKSTETEYATVYETDGTPHVDVTWTDSSNEWLGLFSTKLKDEHYNFYVPKGSVVQTYTLKP